MRTQRQQKQNGNRTKRKENTAKTPEKLMTFAKRAGLLTAGLLFIGGIAHGQKDAATSAPVPATPRGSTTASVGNDKGTLPTNTAACPAPKMDKDTAERAVNVLAANAGEKKIEPGPKKPKVNRDGYEIVDKMMPSSVTPDVGKTTLTMKI